MPAFAPSDTYRRKRQIVERARGARDVLSEDLRLELREQQFPVRAIVLAVILGGVGETTILPGLWERRAAGLEPANPRFWRSAARGLLA